MPWRSIRILVPYEYLNRGTPVGRQIVEHPGGFRKIPRYGWGLVVAGGAVWVFGLALNTLGEWANHVATDVLYANYVIGTFGIAVALFTILIGLTAFRAGERWAWYSIWITVGAAAFNGLSDGLLWGGYWTFLFYGLLPLLGLALSAPAFFTSEPRVPKPVPESAPPPPTD